MANICSLEEIIESFNDSPSTNDVFVDGYGNALRGKAEIIVAKNNYGKTGKCDMVFVVIRYVLWNNIIRIKTWYLQRNKMKFLIK